METKDPHCLQKADLTLGANIANLQEDVISENDSSMYLNCCCCFFKMVCWKGSQGV